MRESGHEQTGSPGRWKKKGSMRVTLGAGEENANAIQVFSYFLGTAFREQNSTHTADTILPEVFHQENPRELYKSRKERIQNLRENRFFP